MSPQQLIAKKRDGGSLADGEIEGFIQGVMDASWTEPQLSALLIAIALRGMDAGETDAMARALAASGERADHGAIPATIVSLRSAGIPAGKASLVVAPVAAACGVPVIIVVDEDEDSSGGSSKALESIPGFRLDRVPEAGRSQWPAVGALFTRSRDTWAPAERKLRALREATATVDSVPLTAASLMARALAAGAGALVIEVAHGRGAAISDLVGARALAAELMRLGSSLGHPVRVLLSSREQPLGRAAGPVLELEETIACLRGSGPVDLMETAFALGEQMLIVGGAAHDGKDAQKQLEHAVHSGAALDKFTEIIAAQGGDAHVADDPARLPRARFRRALASPRDGFVADVDPVIVGRAARALGAGGSEAGDPAVGMENLVKIGQAVRTGTPLAVIHANDQQALQDACSLLGRAIIVGDTPVPPPALVGEVMA